MKVQLSFTAESADDLKKLQVTLASFVSAGNIVASAVEGITGVDFTLPDEPKAKGGKGKGKKVEEEAPKKPEFSFDDEPIFEASEATIAYTLKQIRELCTGKASENEENEKKIRHIMGSFGISKLADLAQEQFKNFYLSIYKL